MHKVKHTLIAWCLLSRICPYIILSTQLSDCPHISLGIFVRILTKSFFKITRNIAHVWNPIKSNNKNRFYVFDISELIS